MDKILIVAGTGAYPTCIFNGVRKAGLHITVLGLKGMTSRRLVAAADDSAWFGVGEIRKIFEWAATKNFKYGIMAGQVTPIALFRTRFDDLAKKWLRSLTSKNAHTIFGKIAEEMEKIGIHVLPASCYMDDYMPGEGVLTERAPTEREDKDIKLGYKIASKICDMDIGQTLLVKDGMILAVEAFEGTNKAIKRGGKLGGKGAVMVKVAKKDHDMRFDIPVVGERTISILRRAGVSALAFQAHRLVMLEPEKVIRAANRANITMVGLDSGLPPAPLRPE